MLYAFSQQPEQAAKGLHATYAVGGWVAGKGDSGKSHVMALVDGDNLDGVCVHMVWCCGQCARVCVYVCMDGFMCGCV